MPKAKTEGAGFLSKSEKAKLQRLYRDGKAAYGSIKNLQKASGLSKKKVAYLLHSKDSNTKHRHATRNIKRLPSFAKRINEIWCLDLAFMDKLSDTNNEVKYLLVCVDVFSRIVRVQPMKSKYSTDAVVAFKKMLRKKSMPAKVWVDQGTEFSGEFRKFCTDKKIKISSTRGLGSQLKDWYKKATSIPYGHLLIDLTPKTVDSFRCCTNSGSIPIIFFLPKTKEITFLNDEHTTSLYADNLPNVFPELQENVPKKFSKRFHSVSKRMHSKPSRGTTTRNTKTRRKKVQRRNSSTCAKKNRNK